MSMILYTVMPLLEIFQRNKITEKHFQQVRYILLRKKMFEHKVLGKLIFDNNFDTMTLLCHLVYKSKTVYKMKRDPPTPILVYSFI